MTRVTTGSNTTVLTPNLPEERLLLLRRRPGIAGSPMHDLFRRNTTPVAAHSGLNGRIFVAELLSPEK
jgi:hypothetical protein